MKRRIFIAILASENLQKKVLLWQEKWRSLDVRWIKPHNLHVTLVPPWYEQDIDNIDNLLKSFKVGINPFEIQFDEVSFGPNPDYPRLIWAKGNVPVKLTNLVSEIGKILLEKTEKRKFLMHMTLARFNPENFSSFPLHNINENIYWKDKVKSFFLVESCLKKSGAEYKKIAEFKL